jgi:hypothetical protein
VTDHVQDAQGLGLAKGGGTTKPAAFEDPTNAKPSPPVIFLLWTVADARAACQKIPDLIAQLRPHPVERYFTRELIPLPFDELVSKADMVVEGTVRPIETSLTEDQCYLYTDYEVSPIALLFGKAPTAKTPGPKPLVVRLIGGQTTIDGVEVIVRDEQLPPSSPGSM